jgi:integrase
MNRKEDMGKENTDSKLDTEQVHQDKPKTGTSEKLKFTDYAIGRFITTFENKIRRYTSFDVSKNGALKGLKLCQYKKTLKKYFVLKYWFHKKSSYLTIGEFIPGKFGTKECQDRVFKLVKEHTDDRGLWIKDPKAFVKAREKKVFDKEKIKLKQKSLRQVIEYAVSADFPSNKKDGRLVSTTIKELTLPAIGYNKRTLLMKFSDDKKGFGKIFYRGNQYYGIAKPENSDDLFNKFPPGQGIVSTKKLSKYKNNQDERSMYDDDIGLIVMENLSTQVIRNYIFSKDRSYSKRRNLKRAFKYFWSLANNKGWISGDIKDPTENIDIPQPDKVEYSGARFNNRRFTPEQIKVIWNALIKNSDKHPFSTEALMLMCTTGKRKQELLKIRKEYIKEDDGVIVMPHFIMKTKKDHEITITEPVKWVLNKIKERLKDPKYQKYTFVPWLFPSTKTKTSKLYDQEYINGNGTRLQDIRDCWLDVVKETGIDGAPKMFRKTFVSLGMIHLKEHWKVQMLSGHAQSSTIDVSYNKSTREQQKEYADEVADKVFNFVK